MPCYICLESTVEPTVKACGCGEAHQRCLTKERSARWSRLWVCSTCKQEYQTKLIYPEQMVTLLLLFFLNNVVTVASWILHVFFNAIKVYIYWHYSLSGFSIVLLCMTQIAHITALSVTKSMVQYYRYQWYKALVLEYPVKSIDS